MDVVTGDYLIVTGFLIPFVLGMSLPRENDKRGVWTGIFLNRFFLEAIFVPPDILLSLNAPAIKVEV